MINRHCTTRWNISRQGRALLTDGRGCTGWCRGGGRRWRLEAAGRPTPLSPARTPCCAPPATSSS
eukprot:3045221-Rhodomonas_salina.1